MKTLLLILSLSLSSLSLASDFPDASHPFSFLGIDSDSGIHGPPYQKIVDELADLAWQYPEYAQLITYGKSVDGRPLSIIKIAKKGATAKLPAIYIGGSIHGDEYLNIEDRLPRWLLENIQTNKAVGSFLERGGAIYIAPILNPDGYDHRRRTNSNYVDLNRDFTVKEANVKGFKEIETASLYQFLKSDLAKDKRRLDLAMDYHCCIGALLYPWSFTGPKLPVTDKERHARIGKIMQQQMGNAVRFGTTPVILGYSAKGTSKDFYYEEFGATGFTYEGRRHMEDKFFTEHTQMWAEILKGF